jgi:hypothetical protein
MPMLWAGWKDGNTWLQGPDPPFMGFLTQLEGGGAAVHTISGQVNSLQFLEYARHGDWLAHGRE